MNEFKILQTQLEKMFPSLTVFSDLDWDTVAREYIASHDERPQDLEAFTFNFPQFLQDKAEAGDCPVYLFELAYFELIQHQISVNDLALPKKSGLYLNPSVSFLSLEYDIGGMVDNALKGTVEIQERPHILCLYRHPQTGPTHVEVNPPILKVLELLEDGPKKSRAEFGQGSEGILSKLINQGIVIEVPRSQ